MPTPTCPTTSSASADGLDLLVPQSLDPFAVTGDQAKTTGSSPPYESVLSFPFLWNASAYASANFAPTLPTTPCPPLAVEQASIVDFNPVVAETTQPITNSKNTYQLVKTATGLGWHTISFLDNRSQFTRYYLAGDYASRLTSYSRPQINFTQNLYIPAAMQGNYSPSNAAASATLAARTNNDIRTVGYFGLGLSGISLMLNLPVLSRSWDEANSGRSAVFFVATATDMTTTVLHTTAPAIRSQAIVANTAGATPKAAALGKISHQFAFAANLAQMTSAGLILVDQALQLYETGECNYGMISFNLTKLTFGLSNFVRSVQALDDIAKANPNDFEKIFLVSMGGITSEKWLFIKSVAKLIMALGLVANIYLLHEAIHSGDKYKIASAFLGLASNICFLIGVPELAAGPLAPIGGTWCLAGYMLITVQMIIDNRAYLKQVFDQTCSIGAEGWQDLLTEVSDFDEIKTAATKPLHFLNLKRQSAGLQPLTANQLLAGLAALGVNETHATDAVVGENEFNNFKVLKAFTLIENHYYGMLTQNNGQITDEQRVQILKEIATAFDRLVAAPKAQAALLVLLGPLIIENQKFATAMASSEYGMKLQKQMDANIYYNQFKSIIFGDDESYFVAVTKTKLRTQAWESTKSWMGEQLQTYNTDYWTLFQITTWGDDYLAYWNKLQHEKGFAVEYNSQTMLAKMKMAGVDRFDRAYIAKEDQRSVRILYEVSGVLRQMVDESKAPSETTRLDILGRIYNTWSETLRGNPEAQAAFLVLLEPVILTNRRYKSAMAKYGWGQSLSAALRGDNVLAFKRQLGLVEAQPILLSYNGMTNVSFSPRDPHLALLASLGAKPPANLDMEALQRLNTNPDQMTANWDALYASPATASLPTLQDGDLGKLMVSLESLPAAAH